MDGRSLLLIALVVLLKGTFHHGDQLEGIVFDLFIVLLMGSLLALEGSQGWDRHFLLLCSCFGPCSFLLLQLFLVPLVTFLHLGLSLFDFCLKLGKVEVFHVSELGHFCLIKVLVPKVLITLTSWDFLTLDIWLLRFDFRLLLDITLFLLIITGKLSLLHHLALVHPFKVILLCRDNHQQLDIKLEQVGTNWLGSVTYLSHRGLIACPTFSILTLYLLSF